MLRDESLASSALEPAGLVRVCCACAESAGTPEPAAQAARGLSALGEMTGGIAHDLLNVFAVVEAGLLLAERAERPEEALAYIAAARDGVGHGVNLIHQLLELAKDRQSEPRLEDPNDLLRRLDMFLKYGAGPTIAVVLELASEIPMCLIEPSQFNSAILNLVVNARDAMPAGGEVRISTERWNVDTAIIGSPTPGGYVRIRVQDNGQGMSPEIAAQIFDPFFTTKGAKGTGLGLPQVCAFMRLTGGHISVASKRGLGTVVDLFFPVAAEEGVAATLS
jgi:signal transduction histidine kinase